MLSASSRPQLTTKEVHIEKKHIRVTGTRREPVDLDALAAALIALIEDDDTFAEVERSLRATNESDHALGEASEEPAA